MEMKNSGELSDAAFAFLVERWCLKPDTLNAFAIGLYGRFKDDIIIVARNRHLTKHFRLGHEAPKQILQNQSEGDLGHVCQISGSASVERWISIRHKP